MRNCTQIESMRLYQRVTVNHDGGRVIYTNITNTNSANLEADSLRSVF